jgi:hypothetical protein
MFYIKPQEVHMDSETRKRKPGAQPGNQNAVKHGFYARLFTAGELEDLSNQSESLEDEISMMRVAMQRVFELACQTDPDLNIWRGALNDLGLGAYRLSNLLKAERDLASQAPMIASALSDALEQVLEEMRA